MVQEPRPHRLKPAGYLVPLAVALGLVFVYQTSIPDSWLANRMAQEQESAPPKPGARLRFMATAYCKGTTTASGVSVQTGMLAADPAVLPLGSVVRLDTADSKLDGIWTVMDTGPSIQGRSLDLYLWSCHEAQRFGRQPVTAEIMRLGWNPQSGR